MESPARMVSPLCLKVDRLFFLKRGSKSLPEASSPMTFSPWPRSTPNSLNSNSYTSSLPRPPEPKPPSQHSVARKKSLCLCLSASPVGIKGSQLILISFQDEMYYAFFSGWRENPPSIRLSSIKPKKSPTIPSALAPSAYASLFCFPPGSEPRWNKSHPSLA